MLCDCVWCVGLRAGGEVSIRKAVGSVWSGLLVSEVSMFLAYKRVEPDVNGWSLM